MVQESCISIEWISEIARKRWADKVLVQKLIRALILLEGLAESEIQFVFKYRNRTDDLLTASEKSKFV